MATEGWPNHGARQGSAATSSTSLRRYLREMGEIPLLDAQHEAGLASQLTQARQAIAQIARGLPLSCREFVLAGDEIGPTLGAAWPLRDLDQFLSKLTRRAVQFQDTTVGLALREIRTHKTLLDGARDALILANLRLVVYLARKYARSGLPLMDLIQEGNVGLLRAVERFEPARGHRFSTYALWWIRQGVECGIKDKSRTIRVPLNVRAQTREIECTARELRQRLGRETTSQDIATTLRLPLAAITEALTVVREPVALESSLGSGDRYDPVKWLADERTLSPCAVASQREIAERVASVLRQLTPREASILRLRFGIGRDDTRTLEKIGERLNLSRERVRQIESLALAKLKRSPLCQELRAAR